MLRETKSKLKSIASEIRALKNQRPLKNRGAKKLWEIESNLNQLRYHFRHTHIAYCELRGRSRDQIEKPSESNKPNQSYIDKIKKEILDKYETEQAIRACA
jgi:hypothetical protein